MNCIRCEKELRDLGIDPSGQPQPIDGLAFHTRGHYGSTYFDPVIRPVVLQLVVCDECVEKLEDEGRVTRWTSMERPTEWLRISREEEIKREDFE